MRKKFSLSMLAALAAMLCTAAVAMADTVTPGTTSGNGIVPTVAGHGNVPDCPAGTIALKITPEHARAVIEGSSNGVTITQTQNVTGPADNNVSFSFTATGGTVSVVYVKAKPDIAEYNYGTSPVTSDSNITAPFSDAITDANGNATAENIEFVVYCVTPTAVAAVTLRSVTAKRSAKGVTVNWRTASEIDVAGYNVYGLVHGKRVKLNAHIIASKGAGANSYAYQYRTIKGQKAPSRFWLQSINLDGSRQWHAARAAR